MKEPIYHVKIKYKHEIYDVVGKDSKKYFKIHLDKKNHIEVEKKLCKVISRKKVGISNI